MSLIAGPLVLRSETTAGTPRRIYLPPRPGGSAIQRVEYDVRVDDRQGTTGQVGVEVWHGPTADSLKLHSTAIALTTPSTVPTNIAGCADVTKMLGEWIQPVLLVDKTAGDALEKSITIELHEKRYTPYGPYEATHVRILPPTRLRSGSGAMGTYADFPCLPARPSGSKCAYATYALVVLDCSSAALLKLRLEHGPDPKAFAVHTTAVIAQTAASAGLVLRGDTDKTKMLSEYLLPKVQVGTNDSGGAEQYVEVELWETRHAPHRAGPGARFEQIGTNTRVSSSAVGNDPGFIFPTWDGGREIGTIRYDVHVAHATSGAVLDLEIQTAPYEGQWVSVASTGATVVTSGTVMTVDNWPSGSQKGLSDRVRLVVKTKASAGDDLTFNTYGLSKPF